MPKKLNDYQKYQLQWMIAHDYSLEDLMNGLSEQIGYGMDLNECFNDWCQYRGFNGAEIWACESEWKNNEEREGL
jgi:hypothetical protein